MPRNFDLAGWTDSARNADWRDPRVFVRVGLGVLVVLNLVTAAFAFHVFGRSPQQVADELAATQNSVNAQRNQLTRTRQIVGKVEKASGEGNQFLATYMTPRRTTYSTVVSELQQAAESSSLTWKEGTIAPLDPVKGSADLSMMTINASFEGTYPNLLKFINLLDRSPRFLIINQLAATPQPNGHTLSVTLKVNAFVRGDTEGAI